MMENASGDRPNRTAFKIRTPLGPLTNASIQRCAERFFFWCVRTHGEGLLNARDHSEQQLREEAVGGASRHRQREVEEHRLQKPS